MISKLQFEFYQWRETLLKRTDSCSGNKRYPKILLKQALRNLKTLHANFGKRLEKKSGQHKAQKATDITASKV